MKDFEGFIKNYATRDFIYFFAEKSIEIYKNQVEKLDEHLVCNITFPLNIIQHGFIHKQAKVMLSAWDIPNMAYLSITNANDYRNDIMTEQLAGRVVNLYRGYENKHSGSEYIRNNGLPGIFKYLMGMSYEQFKYANPAWIYQNYNRNYHMLIGSPNINREKIVDINVITNELFGLTAEELLEVEYIIWWLCSIHPDPLSAPEELYRVKENSILTKKNLERVISYYSVTYEQVRNSSLGKQIFYNKPFVITQKTKEAIAVSFYLVQMMIADGLYWLIRDYYHNNHWGQKFINAFGEMFEDYFEELAGLYLPQNSWYKIPEERKKSADYYVEVDEAVFLFELKSGLLGLGAKQQVPDVGQIDTFYNRNIKEAYEQLKVSEQEYRGEKPVIKVFLLYESMTNTQMIVASLPEIFEQDPRCYIMTIDDLEMLLATYKEDKGKFDDVVRAFIQNKRGDKDCKSALELLNLYQAVGDMHFIGERDYLKKIVEKLEKELGTDQ